MKSSWNKIISICLCALTCLFPSFLSAQEIGEELVEQPAVILAVAPVYPSLVGSPDISGRVDIKLEVNKTGNVISAQAINGPPLLRKSSEQTARRWRFAPTTSEVEVRTVSITFLFRIMPNNTSAEDLTPIFTPPYQVEIRHPPFTSRSGNLPTYETTPRRRRKN